MFKITWLILILSFTLMLFMPAMSVMASDTSQTTYVATIRVTNNGTSAAYNVTVPVAINTSYLISSGYMAANLSNTAMQDNLGVDTGYSPVIGANTTWLFFVPSIPANSTLDYALYLGGSQNTNGRVSAFQTATGLTTADNSSLEVGSNFSIALSGYFDASGTGTNIISKGADFYSNLTTANTMQTFLNGNYTQAAGGNGVNVGTTYKRVGTTISDFPSGIISSVSLTIYTTTSPTGNFNCVIRKVSDDSLVGNLGSINSSTITGTPTWYSFSTPVTIPTTEDIRILLEYNNPTNPVTVMGVTGTGPNQFTWYDPLNGYSEALTVKIGMMLVYNSTISNSLTTGYHDIQYIANATSFNIMVDGDIASHTYGSLYVADNSDDWITFGGNSSIYTKSQTISINGTPRQIVAWNDSTTLTDLSGNGNPATMIQKTTGLAANVSAVLVDFNANHEAILTDWSLYSYDSFIGDVPDMPGGMYAPVAPVFPGHSIPDEISDAGGIPRSLFWFLIPCAILVLIGLMIHDKTKSLAAQAGIVVICLVFISLIHIWSFWVIIPVALIGGAAVLAGKVFNY